MVTHAARAERGWAHAPREGPLVGVTLMAVAPRAAAGGPRRRRTFACGAAVLGWCSEPGLSNAQPPQRAGPDTAGRSPHPGFWRRCERPGLHRTAPGTEPRTPGRSTEFPVMDTGQIQHGRAGTVTTTDRAPVRDGIRLPLCPQRSCSRRSLPGAASVVSRRPLPSRLRFQRSRKHRQPP